MKNLRHILFVMTLLIGLAACSSPKPPASHSPIVQEPKAEFDESTKRSDAPGSCTHCGRVVLVYLEGPNAGPINKQYVDDLATQLVDIYGLDVSTQSTLTLEPASYDAGRSQYEGSAILENLAKNVTASETKTAYIALTNEDLFFSDKPEWRFTFGVRDLSQKAQKSFAVISANRMVGQKARRRMLVMVGKYFGAIACGFESSDDRSSIMFNNILSADDLDAMQPVLCHKAL